MQRLKLFLFALVLLSLIVPAAAQEETTITITEADLNAAIAEMMASRDLPLEVSVDLKKGIVELTATASIRDRDVQVVIIIIGFADVSGLTWTATSWEAYQTGGSGGDTIPQEIVPDRMISVPLQVFERAVMQEVRGIYDASSPYIALKDVTVSEDSLTITATESEQEFDRGFLPPNVVDNGDGTLTMTLTESMMNEAFAIVVANADAIDHFRVEIDGINAGYIVANVGVTALCNNEVLPWEFRFLSTEPGVAEPGERVVMQDVDGDGDEDWLITMTLGSQSLQFTVDDAPTCAGEALSPQQSNRIINVLVGLMQRFFDVQVRRAEIVEFNVIADAVEITFLRPESGTAGD